MDRQQLLKRLAQGSYARRYGPLEYIFHQGQVPTEGLAFVLDGSVKIIREHHGTTMRLGTIEAGEFFGETALILDRTRSADALADTQGASILFMDSGLFMRQGSEEGELIPLLFQVTLNRIQRVEQVFFRHLPVCPWAVDPSLEARRGELRQLLLTLPAFMNNSHPIYSSPLVGVFQQGERNAPQAFLVTEGEVVLDHHWEGRTCTLARLQAGDLIPPVPGPGPAPRRYRAFGAPPSARLISFAPELFTRLISLDRRLLQGVFQSLLIQLVILDDSLGQSMETRNLA